MLPIKGKPTPPAAFKRSVSSRSLYTYELPTDSAFTEKLVMKKLKHDPIPSDHQNLIRAVLPFMQDTIQNVVQDEFSKCFTSSQRNRPMNWAPHLAVTWLLGLIFRHLILLPCRLLLLIVVTLVFVVVFFLFKLMRRSPARKRILQRLLCWWCRAWIILVHGAIRHHRGPPKTAGNTVFVANHSSLLDVVVLSARRPYAFVGQQHTGLVGFFQNYILNEFDCIWFNRDEQIDRSRTVVRIKAHLADPDAAPLLVFPEGTCVNNKYCVMFKKGAFELGATVIPVAIKYHKFFGDPFWNSRAMSFPVYCAHLLRLWSVMADVWYLEPETQHEGETPVEFANRVKALIAQRANLKNVPYDGYFKHFRPSPRFLEERQKRFAEHIIRQLQQSMPPPASPAPSSTVPSAPSSPAPRPPPAPTSAESPASVAASAVGAAIGPVADSSLFPSPPVAAGPEASAAEERRWMRRRKKKKLGITPVITAWGRCCTVPRFTSLDDWAATALPVEPVVIPERVTPVLEARDEEDPEAAARERAIALQQRADRLAVAQLPQYVTAFPDDLFLCPEWDLHYRRMAQGGVEARRLPARRPRADPSLS
ncbi:putative Glycerol-3-phosphate acyltransferase 9 [Paratrimastix pyriformis]|uniref:Glycerol-3-phosphate acyltransferase 9 n=1 Tax=Paratrimastix pyriformis TaxID=342808 RepID=A0ABQ8UEY5_9EUKA|nr:putative Glycerol-3-phosphate acyltransferase 9 [Paratrimastix pyriformis]